MKAISRGRRFRLDDDGLEMRQAFRGVELLLHVVERQPKPSAICGSSLRELSGSSRSSRTLKDG